MKLQQLQTDFIENVDRTDYWLKRGLNNNQIQHYGLGYDIVKNLVTIPWFWDNTLIGIVGRRLDIDRGNKFVSYEGFKRKRHFYIPSGKVKTKQTLLLVEGSLDAIKCYELGFKNVLATYAVHLTIQQVDLIKKLAPTEVFIMLDGDNYGQTGNETLQEQLWHIVPKCTTISLPEGIDPWECKNLTDFIPLPQNPTAPKTD